MTPFTETTAGAAGRLGGMSMSPAKRRALRALHSSRRGVRTSGSSSSAAEAVRSGLAAAFRHPVRGVRSARAAAEALGVSDRTVRRWVSGEDWPDAETCRRIMTWLRSVRDE